MGENKEQLPRFELKLVPVQFLQIGLTRFRLNNLDYR
jgi:hypothetical protein